MKNVNNNSTNIINPNLILNELKTLKTKYAESEVQRKKQGEVIEELAAKLKWFEEQFRLSQQKRFGISSERTNIDQLGFFDEAEKEAEINLEEPTIETINYKRRKKSGHRDAILENLPVEIIEYDLTESEQICSSCGHNLHKMSTEVRRELKIIPAQVKVVKHVRNIYACRNCEHEAISTPIITAPMPLPIIPGSLASPSIVAYVMSQKYVESMPLYRQEQYFQRLGIELSRQTFANWMIKCSDKWLGLIYSRLKFHLLRRDILHADETVLQVLNEPGRAAGTTSYIWLYRTGSEVPPIILYQYQTTRAGKHPRNFLSEYKGYLQVDGYQGYNGLENVTLVGCWAHARRKFDEAIKALPASQKSSPVLIKEGLKFCNFLFQVERELADVSFEDRYKIRIERSWPILDAFLSWLKTQKPRVLPKSAFGQAIKYCLNQWNKLTAFMMDGRLEIDNNRAERSIKPFVIGRKNWLFSNTSRGAQASAIIYSIIETSKENGLNPYEYLKYIFEQLPNVDIKDTAVLDSLLPWAATLPEICYSKRV